MKKIIVASIFGAALFAAQVALADPSIIEIAFTCPSPTGTDVHTLTNFGNRIAGYGSETVAGNPAINLPFFSGYIVGGANIPAKLSVGAYANDSTDFDGTNGTISCKYASFAGYDAFTVDYTLTNVQGGLITNQTPDSITINAYIGLR